MTNREIRTENSLQFDVVLYKNFIVSIQVIVNNIEYRPCIASTTKKEAKAQAAALCLQTLGVMSVPTENQQ